MEMACIKPDAVCCGANFGSPPWGCPAGATCGTVSGTCLTNAIKVQRCAGGSCRPAGTGRCAIATYNATLACDSTSEPGFSVARACVSSWKKPADGVQAVISRYAGAGCKGTPTVSRYNVSQCYPTSAGSETIFQC
jgi:hypothetical protein